MALIAGFAISSLAETYNFLNLISSSTTESVALRKVKRITFEGTNVIVTTTDGSNLTAAFSTLTQLTFTANPLGVGVPGLQANPGSLCIQRRQTITRTHSELTLDGLPRGIYIARFGQQSLKLLY